MLYSSHGWLNVCDFPLHSTYMYMYWCNLAVKNKQGTVMPLTWIRPIWVLGWLCMLTLLQYRGGGNRQFKTFWFTKFLDNPIPSLLKTLMRKLLITWTAIYILGIGDIKLFQGFIWEIFRLETSAVCCISWLVAVTECLPITPTCTT